jgi:hypothetical protein
MGIHTELLLVTPAMARHWLEHNVKNRKLLQAKVVRLAQEIKGGTFRTTHQGIAIFEDGTVADGQHRLSAIVLADRPVQILVTHGLPKESADAVDYDIAPRRMHDVFKMQHENTLLSEQRVVAIVRVLMQNFIQGGHHSKRYTIRHLHDYYTRYQRVIDMVVCNIPQKHDKWCNANAMAVYVTALFADAVDLADVVRFHRIYATGEYDSNVPGEYMAVMFRNVIVDLQGHAWGARHCMATARKMQRALKYFIEGERVQFLREPKELLWLVPSRATP